MYDAADLPASPAAMSGSRLRRPPDLPWIEVAPGAPYFVTDRGAPWTPVGFNDSISWPDLRALYRRRDLVAVERYLRYLRGTGATCIRLMLECAHGRNRLLERPLGVFRPRMVRLWDDLFALCAKVGLRILLTPFDTFWTWINWKRHPLNAENGGPLETPARLLLDPGARAAIKARLSFAVRRWGGSGVLFAWDLWNEIHPAQAEDAAEPFGDFIADLSRHVRGLERALYGRSHPQTVSLFGPELIWRPEMPLAAPILRHPDLDFASLHLYHPGAIDDPRNTVDPAIAFGRLTASAIAETPPDRPFLDTEHGPIHTFKDHRKTLERGFDEEMFRHMQWAHLASGGVGGGMRWPNRRPHVLTAGMRRAQAALSRFLPLIDWPGFRRREVGERIRIDERPNDVAVFACGDERQAIVYLLRRGPFDARGRLAVGAPRPTRLVVPGFAPGACTLTACDPGSGEPVHTWREIAHADGLALALPPWGNDLVVALRRESA